MRNLSKITLPAFCAMFLASCGGDGGSSSPPPPPPPPAPSALSYPVPPSFTRGTAITQLTPAVSGTVGSYIVAPALPPGLTLNTGSGVISGTPTTISAAANYVVTASNTSGSATATLSLTVNDIVPDVGYAAATHVFTTGVPVALTPTSTGGAATQWTVNQPLPAGLSLNATSGVISGNPTQISAPSAYVITAGNSGGTDTFNLTLLVQNGVLLDLGHAAEIQALRFSGSRIASFDAEGHMVLWNAQTGAQLVSADSACNADCGERIALAGAIAVFRQPTALDVRASSDGAPIATIALPTSAETWWMLAADGSYISAGSSTSLTIWAPNGAVLFSRNGDHSMAKPFAAAGELRLAAGPAGNVIEKISVPGGTTTLTPAYQGTFHSWFLDGDRLLTNVGNTAWVYSNAAVQQDLVALTSIDRLTGQDQWFWTHATNTLNVYHVGAASAPAASYPLSAGSMAVGSGGVLALVSNGNPAAIGIVDFASGTPVKTDYTSPAPHATAFAARNASDWVVGNREGVTLGELIAPGAPTRYSLGRAYSIAAGQTHIAIATAFGNILYFDVASRSLQGEIEFQCSQLAMSTDGTRLAAGSTQFDYHTDRTMRVYELPSETVLAEWPFSSTTTTYDTTMSLSGTVVGQMFRNAAGGAVSRRVLNLDGTPVWSDTTPFEFHAVPILAIRLSPDGSRIAAASGFNSVLGIPDLTTATNIYAGAALTTAVTGGAVGWIDNDRLLVNRYRSRPGPIGTEYDRCEIVTAAGQVSVCPALPELTRIQSLTGNSIYSPKRNAIYDLTSGATLWTSAAVARADGEGAVAGANVAFSSGATVRLEPR